MGQEIEQTRFSDADHRAFRDALREETSELRRWFAEERFVRVERPRVGLEIEAWLVDRDFLPTPQAEQFIAAANDERVVPELSKFNFELNADPRRLEGPCFQAIRDDLEGLWQRCQRAAEMVQVQPLAIGILPTIRDEMLQPEWMADSNRYKALNRSLFAARRSQPLHISIEGHDRLDYRCDHIMLEAACTSLQAHLMVDQTDAVRLYNAALLASAPLVAIAANSPFLYGRSLWAETRIPAFEQATSTHGFRDAAGRNVLRVTFGTGYLRHSFLELFLENLGYPEILPIAFDERETLPHL